MFNFFWDWQKYVRRVTMIFYERVELRSNLLLDTYNMVIRHEKKVFTALQVKKFAEKTKIILIFEFFETLKKPNLVRIFSFDFLNDL